MWPKTDEVQVRWVGSVAVGLVALLLAFVGASTYWPSASVHAQSVHRIPTPADAAPGADWPPVDRRYFLPPVRDQLYRGSCAVFASLAAMEYQPGVPTLSEAYAYSILKAPDLEFDGTTLARMKAFLEQNPMLASRIADEKMPYESIGQFLFNGSNANEVSVALAFNRLKGTEAQMLQPMAIYQASDIRVLTGNQITKDWLLSEIRYRPIVVGLDINPATWENAKNGEIADSSFALLDKVMSNAGHAVLLTNYTTDGYFVFRNSWGIRWGDRGYGYMSLAYALNHINQAMEIFSVAAIPRPGGNQPEHFDIKGNALERWVKQPDGTGRKDGSITLFLSLILLSSRTIGGGIESVDYAVYQPQDNTNFLSTLPLATAHGTNLNSNFNVGVNLYTKLHSFKVCATIHHRDGSTNPGCRALPEVFTWSDSPIVANALR